MPLIHTYLSGVVQKVSKYIINVLWRHGCQFSLYANFARILTQCHSKSTRYANCGWRWARLWKRLSGLFYTVSVTPIEVNGSDGSSIAHAGTRLLKLPLLFYNPGHLCPPPLMGIHILAMIVWDWNIPLGWFHSVLLDKKKQFLRPFFEPKPGVDSKGMEYIKEGLVLLLPARSTSGFGV